MFSKLSITLACIGLLILCAAPRMASAEPPWYAHFREICSNYGFQPGTDAFANCVQQVEAKQDAENAKVKTFGEVASDLGKKSNSDCTTTYIGNQAFTSCR